MKAKRNYKLNLLAGMMACVLGLGIAASAQAAQAKHNYVELSQDRPVIELAICLDASGSMSGLIDAAKQKLWAIVNDLALAEPTPEFRVALLTFGNDNHAAENGWVKVQTEFTSDLDLVSERLFAITTDGGTEYVGRVLQRASQLQWHPSNNALQLIVVAGNESADQDAVVSFRRICQDLIADGIMVNSIYCSIHLGQAADPIEPGWREVAQLADGKFATIDHNNGTIVIATPFDDQLGLLSAELNKTYIPFGASGRIGAANQVAQDANAESMNSATKAARAKAKASALYSCAWDLVDACEAGDIDIAKVEAEELPEAMQSLSDDERQAYIDEMSAKRKAIQKQVAEISEERDAFVQEEMKRRALDDSKAFDNAMRRAILEQAEKRGIQFKKTSASAEAQKTEAGAPGANTTTKAQFASAQVRSVPFSQTELAIIEGVFAGAQLVRSGVPNDDTRWLTSNKRIEPDVVVVVANAQDWNRLYKAFRPDRLHEVTVPGNMLLEVDGQWVLLMDGGC